MLRLLWGFFPCQVQGDRAEVRGLNEVLMRRCGFSLEDKAAIRVAFQVAFSTS